MMRDSVDQFITLEKSIADTVEQAQQKLRVNTRAQELLLVNGAACSYSLEKARKQANQRAGVGPTQLTDIDKN